MKIYGCSRVFTSVSVDVKSGARALKTGLEATRRSDAETQRRMSRDRHFFGG
jgi:hypothetical protein